MMKPLGNIVKSLPLQRNISFSLKSFSSHKKIVPWSQITFVPKNNPIRITQMKPIFRTFTNEGSKEKVTETPAETKKDENKKGEEMVVQVELVNRGNESSIPTSVIVFSTIAAIPLITGAVGVAFFPAYFWKLQAGFLQMTYGSTVLSFFGGIQWGLAFSKTIKSSDSGDAENTKVALSKLDWLRFSIGLISPVVAWISMPLNAFYGMMALMGGFSVSLITDIFLAARKLVPGWYLRWKIISTAVALLSLAVTFLRVL